MEEGYRAKGWLGLILGMYDSEALRYCCIHPAIRICICWAFSSERHHLRLLR